MKYPSVYFVTMAKEILNCEFCFSGCSLQDAVVHPIILIEECNTHFSKGTCTSFKIMYNMIYRKKIKQAQRRAATDRLAAKLELTKTALNFLGFKNPNFRSPEQFEILHRHA